MPKGKRACAPTGAGHSFKELFAIGHPSVNTGHFLPTAVPSESKLIIDEDYYNTSAGTWCHSDGGLAYHPSVLSNSARILRVRYPNDKAL